MYVKINIRKNNSYWLIAEHRTSIVGWLIEKYSANRCLVRPLLQDKIDHFPIKAKHIEHTSVQLGKQ